MRKIFPGGGVFFFQSPLLQKICILGELLKEFTWNLRFSLRLFVLYSVAFLEGPIAPIPQHIHLHTWGIFFFGKLVQPPCLRLHQTLPLALPGGGPGPPECKK